MKLHDKGEARDAHAIACRGDWDRNYGSALVPLVLTTGMIPKKAPESGNDATEVVNQVGGIPGLELS